MRGNERGFTLIELLAAGVIIVALLVTSLFLLRPDDYATMRQNAKRRTDVASIVQAINRYVADAGELPDVPQKLTAISSVDGHYDLCKYLVPKYLKDIPLDPMVGLKTKDDLPTHDKCNDGVTYAAGYAILKNKDGRIFISAPVAEGDSGEVIELAVPKPKQ